MRARLETDRTAVALKVALYDDVFATMSMRYATMPMRYVTVWMRYVTVSMQRIIDARWQIYAHALICGTGVRV